MRGAGRVAIVLACATGALAAASPASARLLRVERAALRACQAAPLPPSARGVARSRWRAPADGLVTARLSAGRGPDWDLAAFRPGERGAVGASTGFGSRERLDLWVERGERLSFQACRRSGRRARAVLRLSLYRTATGSGRAARAGVGEGAAAGAGAGAGGGERISLESVPVSGPADLLALERLGLDLTEDSSASRATVALYSDAERSLLSGNGFSSTTLVGDLAAADRRARRAERRGAARLASSLPTGRSGYRVYEDYTTEMKGLAEQHPGLVRAVVLGNSFEGRPIEGIEIASGVHRRDDGRPVYVQMGLHHAREWPSGELPMEFAHDLVDGYGSGSRITALLDSVRVLVVPVVNVDGFIASRSFGASPADDDQFATFPLALNDQAAYRRRNCRPTLPASASLPCAMRVNSGVDLNRNYGYYWGGSGSSPDPASQNYRGAGPFSEPESQAVHRLSSRLQPTVLIANHTFTEDGKWLRQPGFDDLISTTPDEAAMAGLGDAMAAATGWSSELGYETLGDITGATEDWNYFAQGTYGYTPEIRGANFHGDYQRSVVEEYAGDPAHAGLGVREAYLLAGEIAADPAEHSVISGSAPAGATLRLSKSFDAPTSQPGLEVGESLQTTLRVPDSGSYEWHVNPSGRPLVPAETWEMTCAQNGQAASAPVAVAVDRGEEAEVDWSASCGAVSANLPPLAQFGHEPAAPAIGEEVSFSSTSSDPDGSVEAQAWDLDDDGQFDDAAGAAAQRSFEAAGPHQVSLRVTDDGGAQDVLSREVMVGGRPPGSVPRCRGKRATVLGTVGDDRGAGTIRGTPKRDVIVVASGADEVRAGGGSDLVCGGPGDDRLLGGAGRDTLVGGGGADRLRGGAGRDRCSGGGGRDDLRGCEGR